MKFITGNSFKDIAHYILDELGFRQNQHTNHEIKTYFVKTDYIHQFFNSSLLPNISFNMITHNSDYDINNSHSKYLEYNFLNKWFAQNVNYEHPKLIPIPIGVANPEWLHGDTELLKSVIDKKYEKNQLMYANFNIHTNPKQREYCLQNINPKYVENNVSFKTYLTNMSQAYFSICPLGNGIDSHRIWESLYLKTIPIVEETYNISLLIKKHKLPIIVVQDWEDVNELTLDKNTYSDIIEDFDINSLTINNFIV